MAKTILVIEDDQATLDFLEEFLTMSDYEVCTATSGTAGLSQVVAETPAAVLLDRRLPDLDGVVVCERLRRDYGFALPIIMLTADHDRDVEVAARAAGASDVLRKPFSPPFLLERLAVLFSS